MPPARTAVVLAPDLAARGGAERVALAAAAAFAVSGLGTIVMSPGEAVDPAALGRYFGLDLSAIEFRSLPGEPHWARGLPRELREVLSERRWSAAARALHPDLFMATLFYCEPAAVGKVNYYYTHFPHDRVVATRNRTHAAYMRATRVLHRWFVGRGAVFPEGFDRVLANSAFTARNVNQRWGRTPELLPPPCGMFPVGPDSGRKPWILGVGRFQDPGPGVPHKAQDTLIEALTGMPDLVEGGWELHLVGSAGSQPEVERLQRLAAGLPVRFHVGAGFEELARLYAESSLFWHGQGFGTDEDRDPRAQEHFGITVVEAMSAGLIPVVYDSAGPQEVVSPVKGAGRWRTIDQLRDQTRRLIDLTDDARASLRERCVCRAHEFDDSSFAEHLCQLVSVDLDGLR